MKKFILYLIVISNPYKNLDYSKINVYHIKKGYLKVEIHSYESDYEEPIESIDIGENYNENQNRSPFGNTSVFIPFRFMYD